MKLFRVIVSVQIVEEGKLQSRADGVFAHEFNQSVQVAAGDFAGLTAILGRFHALVEQLENPAGQP